MRSGRFFSPLRDNFSIKPHFPRSPCCHFSGKLLPVFSMGRSMPQLEFRWASLLRALKPSEPPRTKSVRDDGGLTAWCVDASKTLSLPELARKVRVSWNPRMQTTAGRAWWPSRRHASRRPAPCSSGWRPGRCRTTSCRLRRSPIARAAWACRTCKKRTIDKLSTGAESAFWC